MQLTRARFAQQVRAERHFVPHRASIIYGPSQLNAVLAGREAALRSLELNGQTVRQRNGRFDVPVSTDPDPRGW